MIELKEVSLSYGDQPILRRVSLEIGEGERIAILGPNGSGKTTLALCIVGLLRPTEGQVLVDGLSTLKGPYEVRRRVGLAFQNPDSQIVSAVVEREVAFGLENLGLQPPEMRRRVSEALERFGLSGYRLLPPHKLSGGEKARLVLASLWAMRPRYLILDEPMSFLDPEGRKEVERAVDELSEEGTSVIWITQRPEEALKAERVVVLFRGELVAEGPPREVLNPEVLPRWGLRAPFPLSLNFLLRSLGLPLPPWTPTLEGLADALSPLLSRFHPPSLPPSPEHPPLLICRKVSHIYPPHALRGVDLRVGEGEFLALVGPTGSGKTTLAQVLSGVLKPTEGEVLLDGRKVKRGKVGLSFQFPEEGFFEETVLKEVSFGPKNLDLPDPESSAKEALSLVGLDPQTFASRSPFSLSGGEARRVGIASVLAMDPDVLILDEPSAGLDPQGTRILSEVLRSLHREGRTLVLISHDMDLVAELVESAVVLVGGRVWKYGPVRDVLSDPNIEKIGLGPPQSVVLSRLLEERGWPMSPPPLTQAEMISRILDLLAREA